MPDSPKPPPPASTARFFWTAIRKLVGFVIGWAILDPIFFHGRETLGWAVSVGGAIGFFEAALLYRKAQWRQAVAPEHVLGFGMLGLALIGLGALRFPDDQFRSRWYWVAAMTISVAVPLYLVIRSGIELWVRSRQTESS